MYIYTEAGIVPLTSDTAVWSLTSRQPSQVNKSIEVELFTCFNVIGHIRKTSVRFVGHTLSTKSFFFKSFNMHG